MFHGGSARWRERHGTRAGLRALALVVAILLPALLFVLGRLGMLPMSLAFIGMGTLAAAALVAGALPDQDQRGWADVCLALLAVSVVCGAIQLGLLFTLAMAIIWVSMLFFAGYVWMHDIQRIWIAVAFAGCILLSFILLSLQSFILSPP